MKILRIHLVALSLCCLFIVGAVMADDNDATQTITLSENVMVNNQVLEKGTYRVTFYKDTGEVEFAEKDGDDVLRTKAVVETMHQEAERDEMHLSSTTRGQVITKLIFDGHMKYAAFKAVTFAVSDN
jgi:hypothetical protein